MKGLGRRRDEAVHRGDWRALIALLQGTPSSERRARERLVRALKRLGAPAAVPALERIAVDGNEGCYVRVAALEARARIGDPAAVSTAVAVLESGPPRVRSEAAELLGTLGGDAAERALIDALQRDDNSAHSAAAEALGRLGSRRAVAVLGDRVNARARMLVRQEAARALFQIGTPEARERLEAELARAGPIARWRIRRWIATMQ